LSTQLQRAPRKRRALLSASAAVASCAMLASVGSGVAAASHPRTAKTSVASKKLKPKVTSIPWGTADGQTIDLYTLHGAGGMKVNVSAYGADIQSIDVPNKQGKLTDVALGFPTLADYVSDFTQGADQTSWPIPSGSGDTYFGATIGQYANRIAKGAFPLNGTTYKLDINNGVNSLHGGYLGWNTDAWTGTPKTTGSVASVAMSASFPAGTGCDAALTPGCTGYPTPMTATVTFTVNASNQLKITYSATNTSPNLSTVINLTNHTYFNLGGQASGTIYDQDLALNSNAYTPTDSTQIPESPYFVPVKGTAFDFRKMHAIGGLINATNLPDGTAGPIDQLQYAHGYDHNWVLNGSGYRKAAVAQDPENGITMTTYTDQPGIQVYTGNYLVGDLIGTTGKAYRQGAAFTEETQHYPDSPNHIGQPGWPSVVLGAEQTFNSTTAFKFGIEPADYSKSVSFK
jgi:aldose 1-epimerase